MVADAARRRVRGPSPSASPAPARCGAMVAGRLAAEVLAEPGPTGADRRLRIQRLATAAVSNVTALDTVLGRLLLAAAPQADPVAIADLAFDDLDTPPAAPEAFSPRAQ